MANEKKSVSRLLSRFRGWIQAAATLISNIHLPNFFKGGIYQGQGKAVCVPGLNCYSCPAASGACPIGAFQAVVGSSKFSFSYYITGFLILLGVLLGRFICGFLCPFGWLQELLHKIPSKKFSTKKLKPLTYVKYVVLVLTVILTWKLFVLIAVVVLSVLFFRPFCKWICPLGAFYGLMNKVSLLGIKVDQHKCVSCGKCAKACKMDVDIRKSPNHTECIRCGKCISACPVDAIDFSYGFDLPGKNPCDSAETHTEDKKTIEG